MKPLRPHYYRIILVVLLAGSLSACAITPYSYESFETFNIEQRAVTQENGAFKLRASVPSDEEAKALFGIPLTRRGIQAVWLEVTNNSIDRARFAPYSVDPGYFPPHEVAYMYRKQFSKQGWLDLEERLFEMTMPRYIDAGATVSGFVFTHSEPGTKSFNVDMFYTRSTAGNEQFTFFINVPGFKPDHAEIDFRSLYQADELRETDIDGLRKQIEEMTCCTTDITGNGSGQPIEIFLVADGRNLLQALLRAGWAESSYQRDNNYLVSTDYFFGRPPDAVFRKGRDKSTERNEMGVWLTPVRADGVPVWTAQIKHAIGRRYDIGEHFLGVRLDPDVNDGRNYLLQNLWYSQALAQYAWSTSGKKVSKSEPDLDFNGNAWFSDGIRLVLWVSGEPVALTDTKVIKWDVVNETGGSPP